MPGAHKKRPLSCVRTEGAENARYHLWCNEASRLHSQAVQQRLSRYRANPSCPTCSFRQTTPGGISVCFPAASHRPAALWRKGEHLLHPIHVFLYWRYPNKSSPVCQVFFNDATGILPIRWCPNPPGDDTAQKTVLHTPTVGADSIRPQPRILGSTQLNGTYRSIAHSLCYPCAVSRKACIALVTYRPRL